jgi:hypothetical protein
MKATSDVSGIGDFDARLLYIAHASQKLVVATGLEAFFNTASPVSFCIARVRFWP